MLATTLTLFLLSSIGAINSDDPQEGPFLIQGIQVAIPGELSESSNVLLQDGAYRIVEEDYPEAGLQLIQAESDWVLYPGMVHGNLKISTFGLPESPYKETATDPKSGPIVAMERGSREALRGWLHVADQLDWNPADAKEWREAGFTSAYVLPKSGILRGHSAWISLNGEPLGNALLQREGLPVFSLRNNLGGGYPRTSMAVLATLRQAFLDQERNSRWKQKVDPDLDALRPGIFLASTSREIENVLDLLSDYTNNWPAVLVGGRDAWKHARRLQEQNVSVLYVLDLDDSPKTDEDLNITAIERRPYWQTPQKLREEQRLEHQKDVEGFLKLQESGVSCALLPAGNPGKFQKALTQLRDAGMSVEDLRVALSSDLLSILNLNFPWRSHAADLLISRGPLDPATPKLAWTFADGRGWEHPEEDKEKKETGEDQSESDQSMGGDWLIHFETPRGEREFGVALSSEKRTVLMFDPEDPSDREPATDISYSGNTVSFKFTPPEMPAEMEAEFRLDDNAGTGTISAFGHDMGASITRLDTPTEEPKPIKESEQEKESDPELGHPEWLVETQSDRLPKHILKGDVFLQGATLYPMTGASPFVGDLLIQGGRIAGIGPSISTLQAVPTIDASGWHITPGIIDPHSHLALDGINEGSVAISAECSVDDMIHAEDVGIWRAAAGGTAVVQSLHGSANPIGGQAAVWELNYWEPTQAGLRLPGAPQGIKFALGENVKQSNWSDNWGKRFPDSRMGVQAVYRRAFTAAQDYAKRRKLFENGSLPSFRKDVRLETLADILAGKIHIQCHSYRADELQMFLGICEEFGIRRPTFQHVLEGYKLAPEIAAYGAMASTFSDWWAYKFEVYDAIPWNVALLTRAGVITTINSDSDEMIRRLNTEAGKSLRYGQLSIEECLRLCTLNGAKQLHVEERLGSLEVGKDGTITAFDGPPLSTWSRCTLTLARGRTLFERDEELDARWAQYTADCSTFAKSLRGEGEPLIDSKDVQLDWGPWTRQGQGLSFFVHNVVLHTSSSPDDIPTSGAIHIQDGRIRWLGKSYNGSLPANTEMIDGHGMGLYPTFINTGDQLGIMEVEQVRSSRDDRETGKDHPDLSVASAIHSDSRHIPVTRLTGIGHALTSTVSGRIRGQAALIQMDGDTTEEMVVVPDIALHIAFPGVKKAKPGEAPSRPKQVEELDRWMDDALEYGNVMEEARKAGGETWARFHRDSKLEALLPYALGKKPVILDANGPFSVMAARNWAKERSLDPIYMGAMGAWKIAGFLGADQARILTGSVHSLPRSNNDPFDSPYRNAGILAASGCRVGLRTGDTHVARNLPFQAATAGAHGAGPNQSLHFLTLGAAEALGISDYTGSIELGKAANFFLAEGDPLDNKGQIRRMWLGGAEVLLESEQTRLRDRYSERIERMPPPHSEGTQG